MPKTITTIRQGGTGAETAPTAINNLLPSQSGQTGKFLKTDGTNVVWDTANNYAHPNHTGDVTSTGDGETVIAANAVTNAKAADMATKTYKGRTTAGTGDPEDVPVATLKADLVLVKADVGLGNVDNTSDATKNSATATLTNKRITKRITTEASSATPTINTNNCDIHKITALSVNITSMTTNLTGTPTDGQLLMIQITGTAARTITWGASFESSTVTLPSTTVTTARLDVGFIWNAETSKWRCIAVA